MGRRGLTPVGFEVNQIHVNPKAFNAVFARTNWRSRVSITIKDHCFHLSDSMCVSINLLRRSKLSTTLTLSVHICCNSTGGFDSRLDCKYLSSNFADPECGGDSHWPGLGALSMHHLHQQGVLYLRQLSIPVGQLTVSDDYRMTVNLDCSPLRFHTQRFAPYMAQLTLKFVRIIFALRALRAAPLLALLVCILLCFALVVCLELVLICASYGVAIFVAPKYIKHVKKKETRKQAVGN
ncbi:hypothetical protein V1505DRAFT_54125 [Lipomyces doorenjongii]